MPFSGSPLLIAYKQQRNAAKTRDIPFLLTFEQWLKIWTDSGHLHERGRLSHQYVMARKGDAGPYSMKNVYIITARQNGHDGHIDKVCGSQNGMSKLNEDQVKEIKRLLPTTKGVTLAKMFNISVFTISLIKLGKIWKHV